MKANLASFVIGIIVAGGFLALVLTPPSFFNFLPFALHQSLFSGLIEEYHFIIAFDVLVGIILFFITFKIVKKMIRSRNAPD